MFSFCHTVFIIYLLTIGNVFQFEKVPLMQTFLPPPAHLKTVGNLTFVPSETVAARCLVFIWNSGSWKIQDDQRELCGTAKKDYTARMY